MRSSFKKGEKEKKYIRIDNRAMHFHTHSWSTGIWGKGSAVQSTISLITLFKEADGKRDVKHRISKPTPFSLNRTR